MKFDPSSTYLFVYGTLCRTSQASQFYRIAQYCEWVGEGVMQGRLYQVDTYPGAVESSQNSDKVLGEVYLLRDVASVMAILDDYEECSDAYPKPHEYVRRQVLILLQNNAYLNAWTYVYNRHPTNLKQILSGSFLSG